MDEDAKFMLGCGAWGCVVALVAFAVPVFIIAAAIKWIVS